MLKNFLKIAYRNLRRQTGYVMGLAVGLGCCFLIALFVRHELSYDQFRENVDKIYRVESDWRPAGGLEQGDEETALSEPYTVVLTHEMAEKYFGEKNPIGQTLEFSKLPESIPFHNLRHSCASWMMMQGVPLSVVQHVFGHSDIQVTQRYAHLAPDVMKKAMQETFAV